jgi:hypothetical protein
MVREPFIGSHECLLPHLLLNIGMQDVRLSLLAESVSHSAAINQPIVLSDIVVFNLMTIFIDYSGSMM